MWPFLESATYHTICGHHSLSTELRVTFSVVKKNTHLLSGERDRQYSNSHVNIYVITIVINCATERSWGSMKSKRSAKALGKTYKS